MFPSTSAASVPPGVPDILHSQEYEVTMTFTFVEIMWFSTKIWLFNLLVDPQSSFHALTTKQEVLCNDQWWSQQQHLRSQMHMQSSVHVWKIHFWQICIHDAKKAFGWSQWTWPLTKVQVCVADVIPPKGGPDISCAQEHELTMTFDHQNWIR